jgi:hypothetical protein
VGTARSKIGVEEERCKRKLPPQSRHRRKDMREEFIREHFEVLQTV